MKFNPLRLLADLSGGSQRRFVVLLAGQMQATVEGAELVRVMVASDPPHDDLRKDMARIEHEGDAQRAGLVELLGESLVTPIDREDLFRLSRAIDDVLDNLRDFAVEWRLLQMPASPLFEPLLGETIHAMELLREATEALVDGPRGIGIRALRAKKAGNQIRRLYQSSLADVLNVDHSGVSPLMLKNRELLRRLDIVGLRVRQAADVLADAAVKRSQ